ncbi:MAG: helix-turn-helix domain-containing protein [Aureibaculum sp.]|nr:helix-turn-helix domain-containing protein [Aureibaculum sp.]
MSGDLSMDQVLLKKLNDVLEDNVANELFGVKELTEELGMSRAQLHRKLHDLTGKSTSQFIREFRLEKAMEMLRNNVATASEISYRVGFNSPTYFNTSFHAYYGYPPGEVKYRNPSPSEDNKNSDSSQQLTKNQDTSTISLIKKISFRQRLILFYSAGLLLIIAFSYYLYFDSNQTMSKENILSEITEKSIAILPFKNLSEAKEDKFFTMGVMSSVQNQLSKIAGLKVISMNSMERYSDTSIPTSVIAQEVGVAYLLGGSVQKNGDSVRIITFLIDAKNDQQLSLLVFNWEFKDIFTIQSNIAKQVS